MKIAKPLLAAAILSLTAGAALAQSPVSDDQSSPERQGVVTSGRSAEGPGNLAAGDIMGKRLLDANGNMIGMIDGVSPDGREAMVRAGDGRHITADMTRLSLGMGAHTVIEEDGGTARVLNSVPPQPQQALTVDEKSTTSQTTIVAPPPTVTTTTNSSSVTHEPAD